MEQQIAHVANQIQLPNGLPIQFSSNATLRRATADEIDEIDRRLALANAATSIPLRSFRHHYEHKQVGTSSSYVPTPLPDKDWRYHVLDFEGDGLIFLRLQQILVLTEPPVYLAFRTITGLTNTIKGISPMQMHILERAERLWWNNPNGLLINVEQVLPSYQAWSKLLESQVEFLFVAEAVEKYFDLQRLPPCSDMYLLGLFSIIESLVAHKPRLTENLDSIIHQLVNKLALLDECFIINSVRAENFFNGIDNKKAWKKLYQFRSQLAHTSSSPLSAELVTLISKEIILSFVDSKTKELIRFAISQPKILHHLKEC